MTDIQKETITMPASRRFAIVDILRAYALLGVVIINYTQFRDWDYEHGSRTDLTMGLIATYVFFRKSALLLSVLFGYGFAVLIENLKKRGVHPISLFAKRMFWLFVIAFINSCFFDGDILKSYALLGMLLLLFYRSSTRTILAAAVLLLMLIPLSSGYTLYGMQRSGPPATDTVNLFLSHHPWDVIKNNLSNSYIGQARFPFYAISVQHIMFCCFLWGMFIQRVQFVENISARIKRVRLLFLLSIPAFAVSTWLSHLAKDVNFLKVYCNFFIISFLFAMVFFACGIILIYLSGKLKRFFHAMECYGKMTLTNYLSQNIISLFIFSGIGFSIGNTKPYSFYFMLALFVFIVQLFVSLFWLSKFNYGPVEWMWRKLSSQKTLPFVKNS